MAFGERAGMMIAGALAVHITSGLRRNAIAVGLVRHLWWGRRFGALLRLLLLMMMLLVVEHNLGQHRVVASVHTVLGVCRIAGRLAIEPVLLRLLAKLVRSLTIVLVVAFGVVVVAVVLKRRRRQGACG